MWSLSRGTSPEMLLRYGGAYAAFAAEAWRRSARIGSRYAGRTLAMATQVAVASQAGEQVLTLFLDGCASYAGEIATVPASAFADAATGMERGEVAARSRHAIHMIHGKPLMLPVRIAEASQGWAAFAVDPAKAARVLGPYADTFNVFQIAGQALLVIYAADFHQTDLGAYREVGVEVWVRPKLNRSALPGTVVSRIVVDGQFSIDGASALWNFVKLLAPRMNPTYRAHSVMFPVDHSDPNTLAITLPRFGRGRSTDVPIRYYTLAPGHHLSPGHMSARPSDRAGGTAWCTVLRRSTRNEGLQFGGDVEVRLGDSTGGNCFCALQGGGRREACLCLVLRDMGLPKAPVANGWAEQMTGHIEAPFVITA